MTTVRELNTAVTRVIARFDQDLKDTNNGIAEHEKSRSTITNELQNIIDVTFAVLTPESIATLSAIPNEKPLSSVIEELAEQNQIRQKKYQSLMLQFNNEAAIKTNFDWLQDEKTRLETESKEIKNKIQTYYHLDAFDRFQKNAVTPITESNINQFQSFSLFKFIFNPEWRAGRKLLKQNPNLITQQKERDGLRQSLEQNKEALNTLNIKISELNNVLKSAQEYHQTYQPPGKQAEIVRQHIMQSIINSDSYLDKVTSLLPSYDGQSIRVLTLKIRALDRVLKDTKEWKDQLNRNANKLKTPHDKLERAARRNPNKTVKSAPDLSALEKASMGAHIMTSYKLQNGTKTRHAIESYNPSTAPANSSVLDGFMIYMLLQSASDPAYIEKTLSPAPTVFENANIDPDTLFPKYDNLDLGQSFENLSAEFNSSFDRLDLSQIDDMVKSIDHFDSSSFDNSSSSWDSGSSSWDSGSSSYDSGSSSYDSGGSSF